MKHQNLRAFTNLVLHIFASHKILNQLMTSVYKNGFNLKKYVSHETYEDNCKSYQITYLVLLILNVSHETFTIIYMNQ